MNLRGDFKLIAPDRTPGIGAPVSIRVSPRRDGSDSADYDKMNQVWREFFPTDPPARTTCAMQLSKGNGVEIECIALAGERPSKNRRIGVAREWQYGS